MIFEDQPEKRIEMRRLLQKALSNWDNLSEKEKEEYRTRRIYPGCAYEKELLGNPESMVLGH